MVTKAQIIFPDGTSLQDVYDAMGGGSGSWESYLTGYALSSPANVYIRDGYKLYLNDGSENANGYIENNGTSLHLATLNSDHISIDSDHDVIIDHGSSDSTVIREVTTTAWIFDNDDELLPATDSTHRIGQTGSYLYAVHADYYYPLDIVFRDEACVKCGKPFAGGETIVLFVKEKDENGAYTVPIHQECSLLPKKIISVPMPIYEDEYIFKDGEIKTIRVPSFEEVDITEKVIKTDSNNMPIARLDKKDGKWKSKEKGLKGFNVKEKDITEIKTFKKKVPKMRMVEVEI